MFVTSDSTVQKCRALKFFKSLAQDSHTCIRLGKNVGIQDNMIRGVGLFLVGFILWIANGTGL